MDQTPDAVMSIVITNRTGDLGDATALWQDDSTQTAALSLTA